MPIASEVIPFNILSSTHRIRKSPSLTLPQHLRNQRFVFSLISLFFYSIY
ncbi:hypothetical protein Cs308_0069 [Candidatus Chlamydia sanziniae]|uniref:Uncharacterized protein n=1 Tax=Candidatus Chlamydia sanziniae TaxID=1806891 RepID=A0A1A9HTS5_9CHLA|nr:hypothetical protein Cs308_0069 [Candidatus Chlamydia sanziniae]